MTSDSIECDLINRLIEDQDRIGRRRRRVCAKELRRNPVHIAITVTQWPVDADTAGTRAVEPRSTDYRVRVGYMTG